MISQNNYNMKRVKQVQYEGWLKNQKKAQFMKRVKQVQYEGKKAQFMERVKQLQCEGRLKKLVKHTNSSFDEAHGYDNCGLTCHFNALLKLLSRCTGLFVKPKDYCTRDCTYCKMCMLYYDGLDIEELVRWLGKHMDENLNTMKSPRESFNKLMKLMKNEGTPEHRAFLEGPEKLLTKKTIRSSSSEVGKQLEGRQCNVTTRNLIVTGPKLKEEIIKEDMSCFDQKYQLVALILVSAHHCTCYAKSQNDNRWRNYNDASVKPKKFREVVKEYAVSGLAFLLYEKSN